MAADTLRVGLSVLTDQAMFAAHRCTARGSGTSSQATRCCPGTSSLSADRTVRQEPVLTCYLQATLHGQCGVMAV